MIWKFKSSENQVFHNVYRWQIYEEREDFLEF